MNLEELIKIQLDQQIPKAAEALIGALCSGRMKDLSSSIEQQQTLLNVVKYAHLARRSVLPVRFMNLPAVASLDVYRSAAVNMIAEYLQIPVEDVAGQVLNQPVRYAAQWKKHIVDENSPSIEEITAFYQSLTFLESSLFTDLVGNVPALALRGYVCMLASAVKPDAMVFDYGGGDGVCSSTCAMLGAGRSMLIEANPASREFAKWRDSQMGIDTVSYMDESQVQTCRCEFDFGICTEVLEHLPRPESVVAEIARLLKPGGIVFLTTSFRLYPYPSHLKQNVALAGKEDAIFLKYGLVNIMPGDLPFPMSPVWRFYKKQ